MPRSFPKFAAEVSALLDKQATDPNTNGHVPRALALIGRYGHKGQPADLVKAAAALYVLWREHRPRSGPA